MRIEVDGIGIIRDAKINIEGLTVITGRNNSGKTTVGRAVYSAFSSLCNLEEKSFVDKTIFIWDSLRRVRSEDLRIIKALIQFEASENIEKSILPDCWPTLYRLLTSADIDVFSAESSARKLIDELESFNPLDLSQETQNTIKRRFERHRQSDDLIKIVDDERHKALDDLSVALQNMAKADDIHKYAIESLDGKLNVEFNSQVQPANGKVKKSYLRIVEGNATVLNVDITENGICEESFINEGLSCKKTFLLDNPYVLDYNNTSVSNYDYWRDSKSQNTPFFTANVLKNHIDDLRSALFGMKDQSVLENIIKKESLERVESIIDRAVPGSFQLGTNDDNYYVRDGVKLRLAHLAAGAKAFSILKILLEKGEIDESTLLILDEPESHLHPEWQNILAEFLVLMVKELKVKVLLTTHSSNFLLALDAYMRKYGINELCNFYQTVNHEKDIEFRTYKLLNDDISPIYEDFLKYLSEMNTLRTKYVESYLNGDAQLW